MAEDVGEEAGDDGEEGEVVEPDQPRVLQTHVGDGPVGEQGHGLDLDNTRARECHMCSC